MKKVNVFSAVVAVMLFTSAPAHSEGDASSSMTTLYIPTAEYSGTLAGNQGAFSSVAGSTTDPKTGEHESSGIKIYRIESLRLASTGSNALRDGDNYSFVARAMTSRVNGMLSLVSTAKQAKVDGSVAQWLQILSLLATREINAEFAYSMKLSKHSSLDSGISCNLHPVSGNGMADMAAHIQYTFRF